MCLVIQRAATGEKLVCTGSSSELLSLTLGQNSLEFWMPLILGCTQMKIIYVILPTSSSCGLWKDSDLEIVVGCSSKEQLPPAACKFLVLILYFWFRFHDLRTQICENGIGILSWSFREGVKEERTNFSIPGPWVKTFSIFCAPQGL